MSTDEPVKAVRDGVAIIGELIKAAGDNPQVKEAGQELGKTALTLTKTINNALLPLAAVNFAFEKARKYFAEQFQSDIAEKASKIPPDNIVEPKASIAGPALQGLAFSHEEKNLKEMYLNLLASAMDGRVSGSAHPAFVEIIKQLNAEEARLVRGALQSPSAIPIVELRLNRTDGQGWNPLLSHLLNLTDTETQKPVEDPKMPAMVDNWVRLGLIEIAYDKHLNDDSKYSWVEGRPELQRFRTMHEAEGKKVIFQKGLMIRTALGEQFAGVVGLLP
jgi:hypothetical protein